jgi:hypothetical protein
MPEITVDINEYDTWYINEYNGTYALVNGWEDREGKMQVNFCEIKKRDGNKLKVPHGMKGKFNSLNEIRAALASLVEQIDAELDGGQGGIPV